MVDVEESTNEILGDRDPVVVVDFSDGRSYRHDVDLLGDGPLTTRSSESSSGPGGASWKTEFWLATLPPPGPVTFRVRVGKWERWVGSASIEGRRLADAAKRARDLWD